VRLHSNLIDDLRKFMGRKPLLEEISPLEFDSTLGEELLRLLTRRSSWMPIGDGCHRWLLQHVRTYVPEVYHPIGRFREKREAMRRRRILITGLTGQLSRAFQQQLASTDTVIMLGRPDVDMRDWTAVRDCVAIHQPDIVIHAAAMTDVDGCEQEPDVAWVLNAAATRNVAQASARVGALLIYISTNYVFDGSKAVAYHEFDTPNPISVYGASKLAGELEARLATESCFVIRTAWIYAPEGHNFMLTMRRLMAERERISVVSDQFGNPTLASDLASGVLQIIERAPFGTYHVTNAGSTSWFEWAAEIARLIGSPVEVDPIAGTEYSRAATPPANGMLESLMLPRLGIAMPDWRDALKRGLETS